MLNRPLIVLAVALVSPAARAAVIHVPGDQPTIQAGIDAAVDGDEVVVSPGTYALEELQTVLIGSKNITLRSSGGAEMTTIRGGGTFPVIHLGVNTSVVQGFTITEGTWYDHPVIYGGGISIQGGSPTILDCIFVDNVADEHQAGSAIGGGLNTTCTVIGCTFINNISATSAIYMELSATISDCTFQGNVAEFYEGGAVSLRQGTIENCTFMNNTAASRGGAVYSPSSLVITGCMFIGNTASAGGGGVHARGGTVTDCIFESNVANAGSGGGMWLEDGNSEDALVTGCTFSANSAPTGAGLVIVGGEVTDCTFEANIATGNGGGLYVTGASPVVRQCTLRENTAGGTGGGMYVGTGVTLTLTDTTFCQNTQDDLDSHGVLLASGVVIAIDGADCDAVATFGACCLPDIGCVSRTESTCLAAGGVYQGDGLTCDDAECPEACPADMDGDEMVGVVDLLTVLAAWGACP